MGFPYFNLALFFCRVNALKGSKGKDCEIPVPVGISVTDENGKIIGKCSIDSKVVKMYIFFKVVWELWGIAPF